MNPQLQLSQILQEEMHRIRRRNPRYSLRAFANKLGVQPSALSEVFSGKRRITPRLAEKMLANLDLEPGDSRTFQKALQDLESDKPAPEDDAFVRLNMDQFRFIADWFYLAVLSLTETVGFVAHTEWIASRLGISSQRAQNALQLLERLGLLRRNEEGVVAPTGQQFTTSMDIPNASIRRAHHQSLELAQNSLDQDPVQVREFAQMTLAIDPAQLPEAKRRIRAFVHELSEFLETGQKSEVYKLCVQLFPLTKQKEIL